jgi:hypothetical protein
MTMDDPFVNTITDAFVRGKFPETVVTPFEFAEKDVTGGCFVQAGPMPFGLAARMKTIALLFTE